MNNHPMLPSDLSGLLLTEWIRKNSFVRFTDTVRRYYTPEEIQEFEKESCANSRTINQLKDLLHKVRDAIIKGTEEPITVEIPANSGTKLYEEFRRQNDDLVDMGFENIESEVYGVVNADNMVMLFFTAEGFCIEERTRALSELEQKQYNEKLLKSHLDVENSEGGARLYIDSSLGLKVGKNEDPPAEN